MGRFANKDVLVFDLGRVLIGFDPNLLIDRLLPYTNWTKEDIYWFFATSDLVDTFEKGKISTCDFFSQLKRILSLQDISYDEFLPMWNDIFFPYPEMLRLIELIKEYTDISIVLLSNISLPHYDFLCACYPQLSLFDEKLLSFQVGFRKPEKGIYKILLERTAGCRNLFYTDDIERFIYSARALGIDSEVFRGIHSLKCALEKRSPFLKVAELISDERLSEIN